jgi:glycosyltransferase involved in cell wall biosynthesis
MKKITVVIPCYNEELGIASVISGFPTEQLAAYGYDLEVLVIDNNSTDKTAIVARAAGARVILETKKGKGNAIRAGFYAISDDTDYVVMLDGDDTYKSQEILRLIEPINSGFAKVIIGSRMHGRIRVGSMKSLNRLGNRVYSRLVRSVYRVNVTDVLTGYFAWSREVIVALRPHLQSQGFAIEMEMITKMARLGYEIFSVPVSYDPRAGESNLNPVRDGARIMKMYVQNLSWKPGSITELPVLDPTPISRNRRSLAQPAFYETLDKKGK